MYLKPQSSVPVSPSPVFRRRRVLSLGMAGLGCNCRGGNYITGLGDDGSGNPNLVNNPAAGLTPVDSALPPEISSNPTAIPLPAPTSNVPLSVVAPPAVAPNIQSLATTPPILPSGSPGLPSGYPTTLPNPAPPQQKTSWLDQQLFTGIPNKFLLGGFAAILVIGAAARKKERA